MKRKIFAGTVSAELPIYVQDTSSSTGGGLGSLASNTTGLVAEYRRQGQSAWTPIALVAGTPGTPTSGGFAADGGLAGAYILNPPDAALASGARWVAIRLYGAANMKPVLIEMELDAVNYQSANAFMAGVNGLAPPANWNATAIDATGKLTLTAAEHALISGTDVPAALTAQGYTAARAPKLDSLDAAISSRSTYAGGPVASVGAPVTVGTNNDKGGYALSPAEHSAISGTDVPAALTSQGLTTGRAAKLDNLDANVASRSTYAGGPVASVGAPVTVGTNNDKAGYSLSGPVTVGGYAAGQDAASLVLASPSQKIASDATGAVLVSLTQPIPLSNTAQTLGDALNAARAQGFGRWIIDPNAKTFSLFGPDGSTVVRTFTLDSLTAPMART